jgi:hypothetical protein
VPAASAGKLFVPSQYAVLCFARLVARVMLFTRDKKSLNVADSGLVQLMPSLPVDFMQNAAVVWSSAAATA